MRRISAAESGFTITEMVVTVAILGVVVPSIFQLTASIERTEAFARSRAEALNEIGTVMDRMSKDIRQAYRIGEASNASTLDISTYVNGASTEIEYRLSGTELIADYGSYELVLLRRVQAGDVFTYTPDATDPTVIQVTLRSNPERLPETTLVLSSEIKLRNAGSS